MPNFFFAILSLLAAGMAASGFPAYPPIAPGVAYAFGLLGFLLATRRISLALSGLGFCLVVLPFFGRGVLSFAVAATLAGIFFALCGSKPESKTTYAKGDYFGSGLGIFLLLISFSVFQSMLTDLDVAVLGSVWTHAGLKGIYLLAVQSAGRLKELPLEWNGYFIAVLLARALFQLRRKSVAIFSSLLSGSACGAVASFAIVLLQILNYPPALINRAAFWQLENRFPATFSDPNACGIFCGILAPILIGLGLRRNKLWLWGGVLFLGVAPWSGSRSFWMALVLWALFLCLRLLRRKESDQRRMPFAFGGLLVVLLLIVVAQPEINLKLQRALPSAGVKRLLASVNIDTAEDMTYNRLLFARLALHVWGQSPVFGAGWGNFYSQQKQAAREVGVDLKGWRDNPNNFYLQILAESGLIGIVLLLVAFWCFWRAAEQFERPDESEQWSRIALAVILVLFLVGPHLHFEEVRFLTAAILASGVSLVSHERSHARKILLAAGAFTLLSMIAAVVFRPTPLEQGFYDLEHGDDGFFAWSGERGEFEICSPSSVLPISMRTFQPDLAQNPVLVNLFLSDGKEKHPFGEFRLQDSNWQRQQFQLPVKNASRVIVEVSRTWNPAGGSSQGDARYLGVMMKWPSQACLQPD